MIVREKMKNRSNILEGVLLVVLFATMVAFSMKIMLGMISLFEVFNVPYIINRGAQLFYIILIVILLFYHKYDRSVLGMGAVQFLFIFFFLNTLWGYINDVNSSDLWHGNLSLVLAIVTYFVGYNLYLSYPKDGRLLQYLAVISTLALCVEYYLISNTVRFTFNHTALNLGIAYIPLFLTPLLLLNNSKVSWLCVLVVAYVLIDSGKRGGIISLTLSLLLYFAYARNSVNKSKRIKVVLLVVMFLAVFWGFLSEFIVDSDFYERLLHGSDDSDYSSGRVNIYADTLLKYWGSNFFEILLGHGLGSVVSFSRYEVTAHNDFLEALFDFGLVGLISYLFFYILFLKQANQIPRNSLKLKGVFMYSFALTLFVSTFSQIFIYQYLFLFTFTWGAISGTRRQEALLYKLDINK